MNIKQIALLTIAFASVTSGASAITIQSTEQELAQKFITEQLTVGDTVLYNGKICTVDNVYVRKNDDYYSVEFTLRTDVKFMDMVFGDKFFNIYVIKGTEPLYPTQEIKNPEAQNDTVHNVNVCSYTRMYGEKITLGIFLTFAGYIALMNATH